MSAALMVLLAGCSQSAEKKTQQTAATGAPKPSAQIIITPDKGARSVRPDLPVKVQVTGGSLKDVVVKTGGAKVEGDLDAVSGVWTSRGTLAPSTGYEVTATALGQDGKTSTATSSFTTLKPKKTADVHAIAPFDKETVGIGMPIILDFDQPVYNQADVEKALEVKADKPVEGAWRWVGRQQVIYRTKKYWPAQTNVSLNARLRGVRVAKGVYGTKNLKLKFKVGDAHITKSNEDTYKMVVTKNGKVVKRFPVSMGRATKRAYTTTNGTHVTMEKLPDVIADSATVGIPKGDPDYYKLKLQWTVRISSSGEYTHSAPWSVGDQGRRNVSHGCINLSPANAKWFYDFSYRGDIYQISGTDRELEWNNGWGYWQMSWNKWKQGSAL